MVTTQYTCSQFNKISGLAILESKNATNQTQSRPIHLSHSKSTTVQLQNRPSISKINDYPQIKATKLFNQNLKTKLSKTNSDDF